LLSERDAFSRVGPRCADRRVKQTGKLAADLNGGSTLEAVERNTSCASSRLKLVIGGLPAPLRASV
jgi:hypothetical protein